MTFHFWPFAAALDIGQTPRGRPCVVFAWRRAGEWRSRGWRLW